MPWPPYFDSKVVDYPAILKRHRGPFSLMAYTDKGKPRELAPNVSRDEVLDLAECFLTDPRDNVQLVSVWSDTENQWVTIIRR